MAADLPPYIAVASPDFWLVKNPGGHRLALWMLGFRGFPFAGRMSARFRQPLGLAAMGRLAARLRDRGFAFSAGRDWSPAEVAAYLRDERHCQGPFIEIYWGNGGIWHLRNH